MKQNNIFSLIIAAVGMVPLVYFFSAHLGQDAWWDEIISLKDFALQSFATTFTEYPDPNNHIFFNTLNNIISRIIGVRDIYSMLDNLLVMRLLQGLIALGTLCYSFLFVRKFFNKKNAVLVILIITTTIPFLNFSLQLRGYNMSMFFVIMVMFHLWKFMENKSTRDGILTAVGAFLLLYTIPSNIYFLFGLGLILLYDLRVEYRSGKKNTSKKGKKMVRKPLLKYPHLRAVLFISAGAILALLAYIPVIDNVLNNRFAGNEPSDRYYVLVKVFPEVFMYFLSYRYLILIPVLGGLWFVLRKGGDTTVRRRSLYILVLFLIPFVLLFIHNKSPFHRTFILLAPVFAIWITILTSYFIDRLKLKYIAETSVMVLLALYLTGTAVYELRRVDKRLDNNLLKAKKEQDIYYNFYLASNFQPHATAEFLKASAEESASILLVEEIDRVSLLFYLEKYDLESYSVIWVKKQVNEVRGNTYSHLGMYQKSNGKFQDVSYQQIPANLPPEDARYNKYIFMVSLVSQINKGYNIYLVSAFPELTKEAYDLYFQDSYVLEPPPGPVTFANAYKLIKR